MMPWSWVNISLMTEEEEQTLSKDVERDGVAHFEIRLPSSSSHSAKNMRGVPKFCKPFARPGYDVASASDDYSALYGNRTTDSPPVPHLRGHLTKEGAHASNARRSPVSQAVAKALR